MTEGRPEGARPNPPPAYFVGGPTEAPPTTAGQQEHGPHVKPAPVVAKPAAAQAVPAPAPVAVPLVGAPPEVPRPTPALAPQPGVELPDIRKMDVQLILQDLAMSHRALFDERRNSERQLTQERENSRREQERIRDDYGTRLREVEKQNEVLIRNLGRIQGESDLLREEVAVLRSKLLAAQAPSSPASAAAPEADRPTEASAGKLRTVIPSSPMPIGRSMPFEAAPSPMPRPRP